MKIQMYSNPIFALLLIINVFIFPVFRASAAIAEEPVQSMALTGDMVSDALDAVATGVSVDNAFGPQPLPYREFGKFWKNAYEELFNIPYQLDAYILNEEINSGAEPVLMDGHTIMGQEFSVEFIFTADADFNQDSISQTTRDFFTARSSNILAVTGALMTDIGVVYFIGSVNQWNDEDGARIREIVPLTELSFEEYSEYQSGQQLLLLDPDGGVTIDPGPEPTTAYETCVNGAYIQWQGQIDNARTRNKFRMAGIIGLKVAGGFACAGSAAIPIIGMIGASLCIKGVLATAALAAAASAFKLLEDYEIANNDLATNLLLCCNSFPEDCDDTPR